MPLFQTTSTHPDNTNDIFNNFDSHYVHYLIETNLNWSLQKSPDNNFMSSNAMVQILRILFNPKHSNG